jgi:hypothetical protein
MSQPSNLYAEKIFSEHPSALWAFEESVDYLSLVTETQRSYDTWQTTNSSVSLVTDFSAPYQESHVGLVELTTTDPGYSSFGISGMVGLPILKSSFSDLKDTFCVGAHLLPSEGNILSIAIGYVFIDPETSQPVSRSVSYPVSSSSDWSFISETFLVSEISAESFYPLISAVVAHPVIQESPITHKLYVNGLTVGQDSEEFNYSSLGVSDYLASSGIYGVSSTDYLIPSPQYGISGKDAFYVIKDKTLLAKNSGMPLVYGAQNATVMQNSDGTPNVIIPGYGFMNESGRHKEYTIEMWVRPNSFATDSVRIFGPVASGDGLYIDGAFIRLRFGEEVTSHYLGDSFRPLLIHIKLLKDIAILMVNGEQVGFVNFISDEVSLPAKLSSLGLNQDYLGFYTSPDIPQIDMDCFAIYSYAVPQLVAKRRFAYAQAVEFPENVNTAYSGTTTYFDYNFADYTNNYAYPNTGRWYQGISDNLQFENNILSTPDYALPQLVMQDESGYDAWLLNNSGQQVDEDLFFNFSSPGYLYFEKLRMLTQDTRAVYMVFETSGYSELKQVLMRIDDNLTSNNFEVAITGDEISYTLRYEGVETSLYVESGLIANTKAFAGIDIDGLARYFGRTFTAFFGNKSRLSLYVGSDKNFSNPFVGKIFSFNLCTNKNFQKVSGFFQDPEIISTEFIADGGDSYFGVDSSVWYRTFDGGFVDSFSLEAASTHIASYTLRPKEIFGTYKLDILADSYWEDYLPLKYFAQYVTNSNSGPYYDLDFLQFNISYPAIRKFINGGFDTSGNSVKTYVTFQYLATGATATREYFTRTQPAPQNGIVEPGDDWMTTKYEVVNGSIIYLPKSINFSDIAIVTSIEIVSQGISLDRIKIKSLEYASQAFNGDTSNPVGTRFGIPVFPYRRYNAYYDYKTRNPYKIYKRSSPYLYLTSDSGIKKVGDQTRIIDRGISIPVNLNLSENYRVVSLQLAMRYDEESFLEGKVKVFEVESKNEYIRFYLERSGSSGKRARLYSVNAVTGAVNDGIAFYLNGKLVREPFIDLDQWNMLGVTFSSILDFDSYSGAIRITGPMLINNISQYQSTNLQEIQEQDFRKWLELASNPADFSGLGWRFWSNTYIWNGVLVKSSTSTYGITPDDIYKTYIGTNKIIVDDNQSILISDYEYATYSDIAWTTSITTPV